MAGAGGLALAACGGDDTKKTTAAAGGATTPTVPSPASFRRPPTAGQRPHGGGGHRRYDDKPIYPAIVVAKPSLTVNTWPDDAKGRSISFTEVSSTSGWCSAWPG